MSTTQTTDDPSSLDFRPPSYWEHDDPLGAILQNVKGTNRRRMITDYWNAGRLEELDEALLQDTLDASARRPLELIHPSFMGGEYLPDFLPTEVEIARIELQSVTSDVISIRARKKPGDDLIHYRVVDEYDEEFSITPESSEKPLTFGEIINLIDTTNDGDGGGLALCYNNANLGEICDAESLRHFTTVSSDFYIVLNPHYEFIHDQWVAEHTASGEEEE